MREELIENNPIGEINKNKLVKLPRLKMVNLIGASAGDFDFQRCTCVLLSRLATMKIGVTR